MKLWDIDPDEWLDRNCPYGDRECDGLRCFHFKCHYLKWENNFPVCTIWVMENEGKIYG